MKRMSLLLWVGLLIHLAIAGLVAVGAAEDPTMSMLVPVMWTGVGLNLLGLMLMLGGMTKPGAITFILGSLVFIPIGLVGVIGARQALDSGEEEEFERRRRELAAREQ